MFPKIPVSQDPKGAGEGPWRGRGGAEAGEAGEIGEAGEAGEARKTYVSVSCLIIKKHWRRRRRRRRKQTITWSAELRSRSKRG